MGTTRSARELATRVPKSLSVRQIMRYNGVGLPVPGRGLSWRAMPTSRLAQVPPGSQDLLAADVRRRRRVQRVWFELAEAAQYNEVIPPTFEYEEVFTRAGTKLASELIRFVDRDGRLVALRADFTSAIARVAATRLRDEPPPLRLSYAGKVYRQRPEGGGHARETFQLGAELPGSAGVGRAHA